MIASTALPERLGYVGRQPGATPRDSDSWYTPVAYLAAARRALGGTIDLDPYSSEIANETVGAARIFTLAQPAPAGTEWPLVETCFANPPYSSTAVRDAVKQWLAAYSARRFQRGVLLIANSTDTHYFHDLLAAAAAVCFIRGRIQFEKTGGKRITSNTRGSAFFYFGSDADPFFAAFQDLGFVMSCGAADLSCNPARTDGRSARSPL